MTEKPDTGDGRDEDSSVPALLREIGSRAVPDADVTASVRQAVHAQWQLAVARRGRRLRVIRYAAAACACLVLAGLVTMQLAQHDSKATVAMVARMEGTIESAASGDDWQPVTTDAGLPEGARIRTRTGAHVALAMTDVSLRLDADTSIALVAADRIALERGAVYVDSGATPTHRALVIDTPLGSVRHIGTQYQVRLSGEAATVSVREGLVQIDRPGGRLEVTPGERIVIGAGGAVERSEIADRNAAWAWAIAIAPAFDIERQPLSRFLEWAGRELGKTIEYANEEVRSRADRLVLRGSVEDLPPEQALAAVLATTPFRQTQTPAAIRIEL